MTSAYTENFADFGARERRILHDILEAWDKYGLPPTFDTENVRPALNKDSGYVFLVNAEYQTAMLNGASLEIFHTLPISDSEGFLADLIAENHPDNLHPEDSEYLRDQAAAIGYELPAFWCEEGTGPE